MEPSYRGLDYESGKSMQRLRNAIGLTQVGLAEHLGVSVRTVKEWEAGGSYPKTERLKALIALAIQYQAFPKSTEAEEIRALWRTTRQKRVLNEDWLAALLAGPSSSPQEQRQDALQPHAAPLQDSTLVPGEKSSDVQSYPQEPSPKALQPHIAPPHRVTLVPGEKSQHTQFAPSGLEELVETAVGQVASPGSVVLPISLSGPGPMATQPGRPLARSSQNRARMLRQLGHTYRELMDQSLQGVAWLELGLAYKPDAVQNAANLLWRVKRGTEQHLPAGTRIAQVYDEAGYELLILGEPGSGKSTLLLDLAHELVLQAQDDETHPLPMIFPLSTWAVKRLPPSDWIIEQMHEIYDVPRLLSERWVREDAILPLLDGLDEMEEALRPACIAAINTYRGTHHLPLVVCSRKAEYEAAAEHQRLKLQSAVVVQPLTQAQVEHYLVQIGEPLTTLHTTLQQHPTLLELVTTPLMLNVIILTYRETGVDHLPETLAPLQEQIWTDYVTRMVERKGDVRRYPHTRTVSWLSWLAQHMRRHNQTVFYLEHLQPDWLDARQQRIYNWWAVQLPGTLIGIFVSLAITLSILGLGDPTGLFQFALFGAWLGIWYTSDGQARSVEMGRVETLSLTSTPSLAQDQKKTWHRSWKHIAISLFIGLLFACSSGLDDYGSPRKWLYNGLVFFMTSTASIVLLQYLLKKRAFSDGSLSLHHQTGREPRLVHPFQTVHARRFLIVATVIGPGYGLGYGLIRGLHYGYGLNSGLLPVGLSIGLISGLIFGLSSTSVGFILGVQAGRIHLTERLRWTFRSLSRGLSLSKHVHVIFPLTFTIFLFLWLSYWPLYYVLDGSLSYGLVAGLASGLGSGLSTGLGYWLLSGLFQGIEQERIEDQDRRVPNQGIRRSLHNSMIMGIISGGIIGIVSMLSLISTYILANTLYNMLRHGMSYDILTISLHDALSSVDQWGLLDQLRIALCGGLLVCMAMGGLAVWRHCIIRFLLCRSRAFPGRAPQFLDDACARSLLRRVGGGYSFIHRLLLDHFVACADLKSEVYDDPDVKYNTNVLYHQDIQQEKQKIKSD